MAVILVFCPNGHVFESRAFRFGGNVRGLTLRGNRETCAVCGAMAEIMDGEFDIIDGVVRILSAPDLTFERLRRLQDVVRGLQDDRVTPERVAEVLESEAPELSRWRPRNSSQLLPWLGVVFSIIGILVQHYDATHQRSLSDDDVAEIIQTVLDHQATTTTSPPATVPPPPPREAEAELNDPQRPPERL